MSAYLQAQAGVTHAKADLIKAQADHDRATDLFEHNAVAQKEVLNAENALAQAKAAVEQAAGRARAGRTAGCDIAGAERPGSSARRSRWRAPISGKVLEMSVAPGEYRNDTNAPLMTIADLSTVWVASDVPESAHPLHRAGRAPRHRTRRLSRARRSTAA